MASFTLETDPDDVLQALRSLLIPVYEALEGAVPRATQIVVENGWVSSGHLVSHITRAETKKVLDGRNCPVEIDDSPNPLTMEPVAMEGLATKFDGIAIKILKGSEIPKASTEPRKAFYQQAVPGLWVGETVPPITGLLILWDCTSSGTNLRLNLCCTKDRNAKDYWMVPVPHPAEWMSVKSTKSVQADDDLDDLLADTQEKKDKK